MLFPGNVGKKSASLGCLGEGKERNCRGTWSKARYLAGLDKRRTEIAKEVSELAGAKWDDLLVPADEAIVGEGGPVEPQIPHDLGTPRGKGE